MKSTRSIKNLYLGINAHLHSLWQNEGGWSGFHTVQIGDLYKTLMAGLLPMGYTAEVENSLQIRRIGYSSRQPRADVMIFDTDLIRAETSPAVIDMAGRIPVLELLDDDDLSDIPYRALVIYELKSEWGERGDPVAWIELLSPSYKEGQDADTYHSKRMNVLTSGLVFVEIDYLHQSRPTFAKIPRYLSQKGSQPTLEAHPYRIIVIDPRPELSQGWAQVFAFDVDQALPVVDIPLNRDDVLKFDFGQPYRKTFEEGFYGQNVDYGILPINFETYNVADQTRIARRMLTVLEANQQQVDLESGPFPTNELSLDETLAQIELLKQSQS